MLYCMVFDKFPFNGDSANTIKERIVHSDFKIPKETVVTEEFVDFLRNVLKKDPTQRYDLYKMKTHKWLLLSDSAL